MLSLEFARTLRQLITTQRFDLVHAHLYASSAAAALATVGTGVPLIVTEHTEGRWQDVCERGVAGQYVRRAVHVLAVSEGIKRRVVEDLGVDGGRVSLVSNAIPACPAPSPAVPAALRLSGRPRVGVVARLCYEKGVDLFLQAVARIASLYPDAGFVVIGDGPSRAALEAQAAHPGLNGRVAFLGEISGARSLLSELDLLVVPSRAEGTPLVVLEALSAGVPLVAACIGGIPSQIRDGIDGLLVPPENATALAEAMDRLLKDAPLRHSMAEAARSTVLSGEHELMVDRIEGLYQTYAYGAVCDSARMIRGVRRKRGSYCGRETQPYSSVGC